MIKPFATEVEAHTYAANAAVGPLVVFVAVQPADTASPHAIYSTWKRLLIIPAHVTTEQLKMLLVPTIEPCSVCGQDLSSEDMSEWEPNVYTCMDCERLAARAEDADNDELERLW